MLIGFDLGHLFTLQLMEVQRPFVVDAGDPINQPFAICRDLAATRIKSFPTSVVGRFDGGFSLPLFFGSLFLRWCFPGWFFGGDRDGEEAESEEEGK